ncbi:MAG: YetF domain-containing protein [Ketobacter sp.]
MFLESWNTIIRTILVGAIAYISLVLFLRISGRRTLSKMNAFDLVVTVSLGSSLATIILNKNVTLVQGLTAFALLIGMQYAVTWSSVRLSWFRKLVTAEPVLLFYEGKFITRAMHQARVTREEALAAMRGSGVEMIEQVSAVVLETDGRFSVITKSQRVGTPTVEGVKLPPSAND